MGKNLQLYFDAIAQSESSGEYSADNGLGYIGKYQMGKSALTEAGYYKNGKYTGKDGVYSDNDFLNNPEAQEKAMYLFTQKQWSYIKGFATKYTGKYINGIHITYSGMIAASHLLGPGGLYNYLNSNGEHKGKDGFGTSIEKYLSKFAEYDVSEITGLPDDSDGSHLVEVKDKKGNKQKITFPTKPKKLPTYFDSDKIINKNSKDLGKKQGFPTGLAADLFSEEEIEELKKRMEHERLPKETLEKMGEYHKRKFFERIRETYSGDFKDLTPANFIDKDGEFTFIPHDAEPKQTNLIAPTPKTQHTQSGKKDLSKDEKWQSFRKIFRTFFAMPDDNGKPMGKINSADVYNAIDVMETMKKAMHDSEVTQIPDSKGSIKDLNEFKFISDEAQTEMMQSALQKTSNQIKTDVKSEILDEISRQTMFPNREHVENIMRDVFDDVLVRRGYKKSN